MGGVGVGERREGEKEPVCTKWEGTSGEAAGAECGLGVAGVTLGSCRQGLWLWQRLCPEFCGGHGGRASRGDLVNCEQRAGRGQRGS